MGLVQLLGLHLVCLMAVAVFCDGVAVVRSLWFDGLIGLGVGTGTRVANSLLAGKLQSWLGLDSKVGVGRRLCDV